MEINWKFLKEIRRNTLKGMGSVVPPALFIELKNMNLLEGESACAKLAQRGFDVLEDEPKSTRKK